MKNKFYWILLASLTLPGFLHAREALKEGAGTETQVIDIPTADVVDHYGYNVSFRFGTEGAIQNRTTFGVFPRLNLGFGLDGEHILGTSNHERLNKPTINVKLRAFDGQGVIPAIALGFDGQGYMYNRTRNEYEQREKGFYLVTTWHPLVPELAWHLGVDIFDFDKGNSTRGFSGVTYNYQHLVELMFEYDNFDDKKDRRLNYGGKIFVTPVFTVDLIGRNIPVTFRNKQRETERIVRLSYTGSF